MTERPQALIEIAPGLRRLLAPNPSPMTYWGTNTYLLGKERVTVIDPGPDDPGHLAAILAATDGRVAQILVTHAHLDHSPLARALSRETGAPVLAFGDAAAGQSRVMRDLAARGLTGGGEGVDHGFSPDRTLADGAVVETEAGPLTALHTPGHFGNHLAFDWQGQVFSGDLVMGWATSLVSPPDGDLGQFLASCARLAARDPKRLYPGHGDPVERPASRIRWLIDHRSDRTRQILEELQTGAATVATLVRRIYRDIPPALWPMAERNVFAHLVDLEQDSRVIASPTLGFDAWFSLAP